VNNSVGAENLFEIGVQPHKTVMRCAALGRKQSHWIAFVSKRRLQPDKYIAELSSQYQDLSPVRVDAARRSSPFTFNVVDKRTEPSVIIHTQPVGHVAKRAKFARVAFEQHFPQSIGTIRKFDFVAVCFQLG